MMIHFKVELVDLKLCNLYFTFVNYPLYLNIVVTYYSNCCYVTPWYIF